MYLSGKGKRNNRKTGGRALGDKNKPKRYGSLSVP